MTEPQIFQYVQLRSLVHADFWHKLAEIKLDVERLSESEREVCAIFTNLNAKSCLIELDSTAFNSDFSTAGSNCFCRGVLRNLNTVETFKSCDKSELLRATGEKFLHSIENGSAVEDPSQLVPFLLLTYADLKKFNFHYWFAFIACIEPTVHETVPPQAITDVFKSEEIDAIRGMYEKLPQQQATFFILREDEMKVLELRDVISTENIEENLKDFDLNRTYFCFTDSSEYDRPAWMLRNFILLLTKLCPKIHGNSLKVLAIRRDQRGSLAPSRIFHAKIPQKINFSSPKYTGWERNAHNKLLPRTASMAASMDPVRIAEHFSRLNIKLMQWRLLPSLDLDILRQQRCLLFGAGTLGCSIARSLIGWGIDKITFVDCGHVSHSNPVRQSLFTHRDALEGKFKAEAAAERLRDVLPSVTTAGHVLQIPMPGHPPNDATNGEIEKIEALVDAHDVLFLITDSRESRWLPTLLGAHRRKTVITVALGFDSYLVMRHGGSRGRAVKEGAQREGLKCIDGNQLGCYFCNDVTAPGNSTRDRTLDQQCTVTRPGVSNIAAAIAVEVLASICQHEDGNCAPAFYAKANSGAVLPEGILGVVPHSVRGYLSTFTHILPATERFTQCVACSEKILEEYEKGGVEFLLRVFESADYLETVTGIDKMAAIEHDIIEDFDSDT